MSSADRSGSPAPPALAVTGSLACLVLVVAAARAGRPAGVVPPPGPFGLWLPAAHDRIWYAAVAVAAVCVLVLAFVRLYRDAAAGRVGAGTVARVAVAWSVPVLLGPPLFSLDGYSYIAQGWLAWSNLDPYRTGPAALGDGPMRDAVDPVWRDTPAPYGPLALALLRLTAGLGGGDLTTTVYLLRLIAVAGVVATAVVTVRLARPERRAAALALVTANPLVVVHLVGDVHLDALLAGLGALTVLAVRRGWWPVAVVAAAAAFAVKAPGLVLMGYVVVHSVRSAGLFSRHTAGTAVGLLLVAAGAGGLVPNGWGWVAALDVPGRVRHFYDPATVLGGALYLPVRTAGLPVEFAEAVRLGRGLLLLTGALVVVTLLWRAAGARNALRAAALVGGALVTVALAAPTVHPWYAVWGLPLVAASATAGSRWRMVALSAVLCFTTVPEPLARHPLGLALVVGLLSVALFAALRPDLPRWPQRLAPARRTEPVRRVGDAT